MTYLSNLALAEMEATPEFYVLDDGTNTERYTTWDTALTFLGVTFEANVLQRSSFNRGVKLGTISMSLSIPIAVSDIAAGFVPAQPAKPVTVTVYRALKSDLTDYVTLFSGVVKKTSVKQKIITLKCEQFMQLLDSKIPDVIYQSFCNHDVYDAGCGLNSTLWKVDGTLVTISGSVYSATAYGGYADNYFRGGRAVYENDMRLITSHTGNDITLQIPFDSSVAVGTVLSAYPGCDGSPDTCKNRFSNFANFLGMPYIPSENPVNWSAG